MKAFLGFLSVLMIVGVLAAAGGTYYGWRVYTEDGPLPQETLFTIERGQGLAQIADKMAQAGIISQPLAIRIAAKLDGRQAQIKAGEYQFPPHISMRAVLDKIVQGDVYQRQITIPEGLTSWQIVQLLRKTFGKDSVPDDKIPPEGSLLPETYSYTSSDTAQDILARMRAAMSKTLDELWPAREGSKEIASKEQAVILASIVEKETGVPSERGEIAGVFLNRLKIGMALQTDPTVIYALTNGKIEDNGKGPLGRRLLSKDLKVDSPYNTYKYPGLPPGPIANPGRAALEAVLHPVDTDYLYFVAGGTGGHVFSKTLEQHNKNAAKWRKIRKEQNN